MIFSPEKLDDMHLRDQILGNAKDCLWLYKQTGKEIYQEAALLWEEWSNDLNQYIKHGDYTRRDLFRKKFDLCLR